MNTPTLIHHLLMEKNKRIRQLQQLENHAWFDKIHKPANDCNVNRKVIIRFGHQLNNKKEIGQSLMWTTRRRWHIIIELSLMVIRVSQSTIFRWKRKSLSENTQMPSDNNEVDRLIYSLSSFTLDLKINTFKFIYMSNVVHIDEKLFYIA